mgnify:CR=1 FL=1
MQKILLILSIVILFTGVAVAKQGELRLRSESVMVLDAKQGNVIYRKNADKIRPIASITKLMTAMVVLDAKLALNQKISIRSADIDRLKNIQEQIHENFIDYVKKRRGAKLSSSNEDASI